MDTFVSCILRTVRVAQVLVVRGPESDRAKSRRFRVWRQRRLRLSWGKLKRAGFPRLGPHAFPRSSVRHGRSVARELPAAGHRSAAKASSFSAPQCGTGCESCGRRDVCCFLGKCFELQTQEPQSEGSLEKAEQAARAGANPSGSTSPRPSSEVQSGPPEGSDVGAGGRGRRSDQ